jgi:hypothetical protein
MSSEEDRYKVRYSRRNKVAQSLERKEFRQRVKPDDKRKHSEEDDAERRFRKYRDYSEF